MLCSIFRVFGSISSFLYILSLILGLFFCKTPRATAATSTYSTDDLVQPFDRGKNCWDRGCNYGGIAFYNSPNRPVDGIEENISTVSGKSDIMYSYGTRDSCSMRCQPGRERCQFVYKTYKTPIPITQPMATFTCGRIWIFQIIRMGKVARRRSTKRLIASKI